MALRQPEFLIGMVWAQEASQETVLDWPGGPQPFCDWSDLPSLRSRRRRSCQTNGFALVGGSEQTWNRGVLWTRNNAWPRLQTGNRDMLLSFVIWQAQQKELVDSEPSRSSTAVHELSLRSARLTVSKWMAALPGGKMA